MNIIVNANPFTAEVIETRVDTLDLNEAVKQACEHIAQQSNVTAKPETLYKLIDYCDIENVLIPKIQWQGYNVNADTVVRVVLLPRGSGGDEGKNPLATVLTLGVAVLTSVASFGTLSAVGASMAGYALSALAGTAVSIVGGLLVNAIFPSQASDPTSSDLTKDKETYILSGARNDIKPYEAIPVVLGKVKVTPSYIQTPYTSGSLDESYIDFSVLWGYADFYAMDLQGYRLGDNPIEFFENDYINHTFGTKPEGTETIIQYDVSKTLDTEFYYREISNTKAISLDLFFPYGLYSYDNTSTKQSATVQVEIEYKNKLSDTWQSLTGSVNITSATFLAGAFETYFSRNVIIRYDSNGQGSQTNGRLMIVKRDDIKPFDITLYNINVYQYYSLFGEEQYNYFEIEADVRPDKRYFNLSFNTNKTEMYVSDGVVELEDRFITNATSSPITWTERLNVPLGDYDIRVRRVNPSVEGSNIIDTIVWSVARAITEGSAFEYRYPLASSRLRFKATEDLNGVIDTFSAIATSVIYDYDGTNWIVQATNNPASLILYVLTGNPNARRIKFNDNNNINEDWNSIDKLAFEEFHNWCSSNGYQYNRYIEDAISIWELVQQIASAARSFVTLVDGKWSIKTDKVQDNPRLMITPSNAWGGSTSRSIPNVPHGLRIKFKNELNNYRDDERIVYADGYDLDTAELFNEETLEGITHPDLVYRYGREVLKALLLRIETHTVNMDWESIVIGLRDRVFLYYDYLMTAVASGRIKSVMINDTGDIIGVKIDNSLILPSSTSYGLKIRRTNGDSLLTVPIFSIVDDIITFTQSYAQSAGIEAQQLYTIGELASMGSDVIVSKIEREDDFSAKITLVDYAPEIYEDPSAPVPPFESNIQSLPSSYKRPTAPSNLSLSITFNASSIGYGYVVMSTWLQPLTDVEISYYEIWVCTTGSQWQKIAETKDMFYIYDALPLEYYGYRVRGVGKNNTVSEYAELINPSQSGLGLIPDDVAVPIAVTIISNKLNITWEYINDNRPIEYEVRRGETWESGQYLGKTTLNTYQIGISGTYHVKAVAYGGFYSLNSASVEVEQAELISDNIVFTVESAPDWLGTKENFIVTDNILQTRDLVATYTIPEAIRPTFNGTLLTTIYIAYEAISYSASNFRAIPNVRAIPDVRGVVSESFELTPQIRLYNKGVWGEWQNFIQGQYSAESLDFRLIAKQLRENLYLEISSFSITIDVPDRFDNYKNLAVSASGTTVLFKKPFNIVPTWVGAVVNDAGNKDIEILNNTLDKNGFAVKVKQGNVYIDDNVNLIFQGY